MKITNISIAIAAVLFVALGWYLYQGQQGNPEPPQSSETVYSDSIDAQDQPTITQQKDTTPKPVGEDLAPGTALVKATVLSVDHQDEKATAMTVMIDEVMGYGSSTSPISSNTEMEVDIKNVVEKDNGMIDKLKEGTGVVMVIDSSEGMQSKGGGDGGKWRLIEFQIQ